MQTTIGERAGEPGTGPFVMSEGGRGGGVPVLAARVDGGVDLQWGRGGVGIRRYFYRRGFVGIFYASYRSPCEPSIIRHKFNHFFCIEATTSKHPLMPSR